MLFRDVISLITVTTTENELGDTIEVSTERQVFADKQSVRQSEFYQAAATGLRPELMFVVRSVDYEGEQKLKYGDKEYTIIRTYDMDGELTELVCQGVVNRADA